VGMDSSLVDDGRSGFLANSPRQWAEAIARLAEDPMLRREMGMAGRKTVERNFSVAGWGETLAAVVDPTPGPLTTNHQPHPTCHT
jgi:glycosyltransferase involved in cell wall biosynthesis